MNITIPELSLVILIGPSGSGKSTFAQKHFKPTEILSSDFFRGLVSDDENDQAASKDAFESLHFIAAKRLAAGKLTVIDATNVQVEARKPLLALAREYHCLPVAIVLDLPEELCQTRNQARPDRNFGLHVVRQHRQQLQRSLRNLKREGFRHIFVLSSPAEVEVAEITRQPLWTNRKTEHGPFDIIGDIHGCFDELVQLLTALGHEISHTPQGYSVYHPEGRKVIFLGDLVDRGPKTPAVLSLVMSMVESGKALCVAGNHEQKLLRKLRGRDVQITHGLAESLAQLEQETPEFQGRVVPFLDSLISHYVLDDGKLVVAHAGLKEEMHGRGSGRVRDFALYGETTGETDAFGLPIRYNWAAEYRGQAMVVYGHTPIPEPEWLNHTINLDTGCVFGGRLTALRYPERQLVSVPALYTYYASIKPLRSPDELPPALDAQQQLDGLLDIEEVLGKRMISTRLRQNVTIREEQAIAALEVMSRFAANPKWLIYLPPTMSPSETTSEEGLLEHPLEAFAYYRSQGVSTVICEQKHMGSRAVVLVCRDEEVVRKRFGILEDGLGICYTRTGRRFFEDKALETELISRVRDALDKADFWTQFQTDWVCLDCELMPWSAKAQELIRQQYAAVGASSSAALTETVAVLQQAAEREELSDAIGSILDHTRNRAQMSTQFINAYRGYCWSVTSIDDLKLAPFHLLATEGAVHVNKDHLWHMQTLERLCHVGAPLLQATVFKLIDITDPARVAEGVQWWEEITTNGGEGMVVKPLDFIVQGRRGLVQPAVKCRGKEYLRIIYGSEYTLPQNLERLRSRSLSAKRSLALREFALGIEALERFVRREPLYRVHQCVFGLLALESEPVDPRL